MDMKHEKVGKIGIYKSKLKLIRMDIKTSNTADGGTAWCSRLVPFYSKVNISYQRVSEAWEICKTIPERFTFLPGDKCPDGLWVAIGLGIACQGYVMWEKEIYPSFFYLSWSFPSPNFTIIGNIKERELWQRQLQA